MERKYLDLLVRESFLTNFKTCRLTPGYANYELGCECWCDGCQVSDGIDAFVESFARDGCTNEKLESVCIKWGDPIGQQSPALKQLKEPTKVDVPLPKNDLTKWITRYVHKVTQCEMHSLVNKKQRKRMDLYKWTVEYEDEEDRHTAHVLQCRVKSL
ncbi:hypothetical protein AAVH_40719 [Aphelenchoides avenae]|nr:hypothetical protein AAVH_40719 [Aphelenchus avenae]